jgi:ABC-type sulfate transport system substrate-binding protein
MHLREKSSESHLAEVMAKMKAQFLTSWARLRGKDQCIKRSKTGAGSQTEVILQVGGLLVKIPFTRRVMRG